MNLKPASHRRWIFTALAAFVLLACGDGEPADPACETREDYSDTDTVCCESSTLVTDGETCCYEWEWSLGSECVLPDDWAGAGKSVVVDSCCEEQ